MGRHGEQKTDVKALLMGKTLGFHALVAILATIPINAALIGIWLIGGVYPAFIVFIAMFVVAGVLLVKRHIPAYRDAQELLEPGAALVEKVRLMAICIMPTVTVFLAPIMLTVGLMVIVLYGYHRTNS